MYKRQDFDILELHQKYKYCKHKNDINAFVTKCRSYKIFPLYNRYLDTQFDVLLLKSTLQIQKGFSVVSSFFISL